MPSGEITRALARLREGEEGSLDETVRLLYEELRRLARIRLRERNASETHAWNVHVENEHRQLTR